MMMMMPVNNNNNILFAKFKFKSQSYLVRQNVVALECASNDACFGRKKNDDDLICNCREVVSELMNDSSALKTK